MARYRAPDEEIAGSQPLQPDGHEQQLNHVLEPRLARKQCWHSQHRELNWKVSQCGNEDRLEKGLLASPKLVIPMDDQNIRLSRHLKSLATASFQRYRGDHPVAARIFSVDPQMSLTGFFAIRGESGTT